MLLPRFDLVSEDGGDNDKVMAWGRRLKSVSAVPARCKHKHHVPEPQHDSK